MRKVLTGLAVVFVAAVWMTGSWLFFDTLAVGAQGSGNQSAVDTQKAAPNDESMNTNGTEQGKESRSFEGHKMQRFANRLDLTDAQRHQVDAIVKEDRTKMKPIIEQLKTGREQLDALSKTTPFDETKVRAAAKAQADKLADLIVAKEQTRSRIWALLTPEQRAKADQMHQAWKARHEQEKKKES
jgi:Spy/CpxP family protein refolding chaperone